MSATRPFVAGLIALAMALSLGTASAAAPTTITLNPTADGEILENGDGTTGLGIFTGSDVLTTTQSGPLSSTIAFEFDLSGIVPGSVTGVQLVLTQFGATGTSPGQSLLKLQGHAGDGVVTLADISPDFSSLGTAGVPLASNLVDNTVNLPMRTQHVFDILPASLFALSGSLVTLRVNASDADSVTGFAFFGLASVGVDYDMIALGVQSGVPAQLVFTTMAPVPEPETMALMLAGLAVVGGVARRKARSTS